MKRFVLILLLCSFASPAWAADGVIEISQTRALAGAITVGDTAGFPVTISESGHYRLTGNLTLTDSNEHAILVTAADVKIDLNGFSILGLAVCNGSAGTISCSTSGTGDGVSSSQANVAVRNGTIRGMNRGVHITGDTARVEELEVHRCSGAGVVLFGPASVVERSKVTLNRGDGILADLDSRVVGNAVIENLNSGITAQFNSLVRDNVVTANGAAGIVAAQGSMVLGNTAADNFGLGLSLSAGAGYGENVLDNNNLGGAQVTGGVAMSGNVCSGALC